MLLILVPRHRYISSAITTGTIRQRRCNGPTEGGMLLQRNQRSHRMFCLQEPKTYHQCELSGKENLSSPLRTLCHILSLSSHRRFHYVRLVLSPSAYSLIKKGMFYLFQLLLMYLAGSESPRYLPPNASVFERGRADCARRARQRHPRKVHLAYDEPRHRHLPVWPAFKSGSHRDRPQSQHF